MIIKKTAVGNSAEAFIQETFSSGLNIISSDDNNRGKTIAIQSMMYALGNEPTFPTSFDYNNYYHYIEFEHEETLYRLCRRKNSFVLKHGSTFMVFDSVSELKRYWDKHIFNLPRIVKNQTNKIVDPMLFLQIFFVGQDKKDTSKIDHSGFYNKIDFMNMLFDLCGAGGIEANEDDIKKIEAQIKKLKGERDVLIRQHEILSSTNTPVSYLSTANDRIAFARKVAAMEKLQEKIGELKKARSAAATRKAKWGTTLNELRSLNRTIETGQLRCLDCESTNISFSSTKKGGYSFDVSSVEMRSEIIASINEKMQAYAEEIEKYNHLIAVAQKELQEIMAEDDITLESIAAYKEDVFSASDAEAKIQEIDTQIGTLSSQLKTNSSTTKSIKEKQDEILEQLLQIMNSIYKQIDPTGNLFFDSLFTKRDETYSGSEATMFHLAKLYSIHKVVNHSFPIIVDSFRAEDLSTPKEAIVLGLYKQLPNQIIFTTTLKAQEAGKYDGLEGIFHIDYSVNTPSHMLSESYVKPFTELISAMSIIT